MNIDQNQFQQPEPVKCTTCKNFYAAEAYDGLCSSCYKKKQPQKNQNKVQNVQKFDSLKAVQTIPEKQELKKDAQPLQQAPKQVDKKRCFNCKKKVGLLGVECKCGFVYCNSHRLPEEHSCSFNHKEAAKDRLKQELVKVCHDKITQI